MNVWGVLFLVVLTACGPEPHVASPPSSPVPRAQSPAPPTRAGAPRTTNRVVVSQGRRCGTNVTTSFADGSMSVVLDVLENGRGPHVEATLHLAGDGTIQALDARGHHAMGTPVEESFRRDGAQAKWKSREESGARPMPLSARAFYMPVGDLPDALGLLAQALLKAGGKLSLLPAGEAQIEKTATTTVKQGGAERTLVGYAITGLDLLPTHLWMDEGGDWFGVATPWWSVVPEGWESAIEPLIAKQNDYDRARDAALAKALARRPPTAGVAYTHARVLDVVKGSYLPDHTVVVAGDKIVAVGPSASVRPPKDAEVIDLAGKAILPGLWDMHAHLGDADGLLDVASGVTTVRDVGNDPDKLDDYKKRYDDGTAIGPRVFRFGFIEGRGEKAASSKITAETEAEAKAAVAEYAKRGYEGIKIYNSMKPELVPVLVTAAHARKMAVTGHIPVHMLAHEAVRAGYDGIEHVNMLFLNFFADHDTDTRTTTRFTLVGDKAASLDLQSKPVVDFIALLKQRRTVIDPTLDAFEMLLVAAQGKITPGTEDLVSRLPVQTQRQFLTGGVPFEGKEVLYRAAFEKLLLMVKTLHAAKVPLVVGTDMLAGLMHHHELALYVRAGIPAASALRLATIESARVMNVQAKTGSVEKGKDADLFVVDGDPLANIGDLRKVVTTMRGGVAYPSARLYEAVGVKP